MKRRTIAASTLFVFGLVPHRRAAAEERWVDDEQLLAAKELRLSAAVGVVRFLSAGATPAGAPLVGSGLNLEEAVGLGRELEGGVRFGLRFDDAGRGLRADEVARGFDTETFGTGLSVTANPELRLRWRALRFAGGELGLEDRVALPTVPDPDLTETLGAWTSIRIGHFARADLAFHVVLSSQSFAKERVLAGGVGMPVKFWANVTSALFVGIITTTHYVAATDYTTSTARWTLGLAVGYRLLGCDGTLMTVLPDALADFTHRVGGQLGLQCRL